MKRAAILISLAFLAVAAAPAGGQPPAQPDAAAIEASRAAVGGLDFRRLTSDRAYAGEMLGHLDRLAPSAADDPETALAIENLRLLALVTLQRADEARAIIDGSLARRPNDPGRYASLWYAALSLNDPPLGLAVVEQASRSVPGAGWGELREILERDQVFSVFQHFQSRNDAASRVRLAEALFRIGWPGPAARETVDSIRLILLKHRLEQSDRAAAADLATGLTTPSNVAPLIVQRRFDDLFPAGADRLARLRQALDEHDRHTAEALAAAPRDSSRVLERAQHLRTLARDDEALALLEPFTRDIRATATADEPGMWLINEAGYALLALGRNDEAAAMMRRLAALPIADHPYLISASINYGEMLWEVGRYADSLAHARLLERDFTQFASDYGDMWIHATIVCALASLDRTGEAAPTLERMRAGSEANPAAMTRAYLCVNDMAAAEALMVHRLESDEPESAVLALQDYALSRGPSQTGALLVRLLALRERPAVRAALRRVGRVLNLPVARTYWGDF